MKLLSKNRNSKILQNWRKRIFVGSSTNSSFVLKYRFFVITNEYLLNSVQDIPVLCLSLLWLLDVTQGHMSPYNDKTKQQCTTRRNLANGTSVVGAIYIYRLSSPGR